MIDSGRAWMYAVLRGPHDAAHEVQSPGAGTDGALEAAVGRVRIHGAGPWRGGRGRARYRGRAFDDQPRDTRTGVRGERDAQPGSDASARRRAQTSDGERFDAGRGSGGPGRADDFGRSGFSPALDSEERAPFVGRTAGDGACRESPPGRGSAARVRLQPAGET